MTEKLLKGVDRESQYIWLTIYSDLITNLFLLFLSLFALSYFGPDAIQEAVTSMKNRLEYSEKAAPWYEDMAKTLKMPSDEKTAVIAREDRLQMALPEDLLFAPGQKTLSDAQKLILHALAPSLREIPYTVLIEGFADDSREELQRPGDTAWAVSLARAMAVVQYLVQHEQIAADRLGIAAHGEFKPRASNETPEGRAKNRRIEISLLRYE